MEKGKVSQIGLTQMSAYRSIIEFRETADYISASDEELQAMLSTIGFDLRQLFTLIDPALLSTPFIARRIFIL